ncbi:large ribosomal subunit protein bL35m isoform X1 [Rattus norvegicus]|uniref:large ribosomal subunit protein bL35m isoform X1 n=1 Tax=Rattus norvegicus TaxID=10116 RepID=UPI0003D08022|nr:39S ribosomal protein L35, mitochondrial isoform X1 [Rattus norvegicus]XP_017448025.1 39S ribosomal protein L35, mitochondrial isoform X1 [Rattus norvegicus]XP_038963242.1 39S ribosomal protein L35, mitochondrial isoform X1 [Rattus norvegicus]XP_038963244.1 39S ribosomal protein L35, mitochondrial isoform X1 [Rattus norvegicus]|eukprot:XP_006236697.1 PREDICTED: 39S ribosomal protein L35, mitochondrial isoform X1 [Rattus norvegicus]
MSRFRQPIGTVPGMPVLVLRCAPFLLDIFRHQLFPLLQGLSSLSDTWHMGTRHQSLIVLKLYFRVATLVPSVLKPPVRALTYCSARKGKRKTVKSVVHRFLRLHSGLWLRRKAGYKKKLWKKSTARKKRLREFVFCNKTQSKLLDKMTTSFWKRRNWYTGDPYQMYHDRTNLRV